MAMNIQTKVVIQDESVRNTRKIGQGTDFRKDDISSDRAKEVKENREELRAKAEENRKAVIEEQMKAATLDETKGKVISESKDGDTVRASEKSMEALNDGIVLAKGRDDRAAESVTENKKAEETQQLNSLNGYSSSQIDALYREGKISRQDRDKEIERREEIKEAAGVAAATEDVNKKEDDKEDVSKKTTSDINSDKADAAQTAKDKDEKRAAAAKEREECANASEERSKLLEESNEQLSAFERNMNDLMGQKMKDEYDPDLERFETVEGFNINVSQ